VAAGAPEGSIGCISNVSMGATNELMKHPDTALILATGGPGLVRAAYSSGKPALGVGPGNPPAFVERTADLRQAAIDIITGKSFDNGTICASEQSIVAEDCIADELIRHLKEHGAYFLSPAETAKVSAVVMLPGCAMNPNAVGKDAGVVAQMAGITVPDGTRCLVAPLEGVGKEWPLSHEKLTTVLAFYRVADWHEGCKRCIELLNEGGIGHSLAIHSNNEAVIREFALKKPIFRMLVNTPSTFGGIGVTTALAPSLTLGCGTWGGSSVSENVSPLNLINIKRVVWPIRSTERPRVEPLRPREIVTGGDPGIDSQLVQDVVAQVLKTMTGSVS
jgi:acetaldehyde dehydrogenase (acetylating)